MYKHLLFVFLYAALSGFVPPIWLLALFVVQSSIILVEIIRSGDPIVTPYSLLCAYFLYVAVSNINLILISDNLFAVTYNYLIINAIGEATQIYCIGCTCIFIGMDFMKMKSVVKIDYNISKKSTRVLFFVIAIVCNRLTLTLLNLGFLGSLMKLFSLSMLIGIMFFTRLWIKEQNKTYRNYAFILYFVSSVLALLYSYLRFEIILPTIILFLGLLIGYGDIRKVIGVRLIPFIILFLIFSKAFGDLGRYRGAKSNTDIISNSIAGDIKDDSYETKVVQDDEIVKKGSVLERAANLAQITQVVKLTRQHGFYEGKASYPLVIALIPRFIWPDKPLIELGAWFALETGIGYKADVNGRSNNSVNMTVMGQLYLDFGYWGVVFGCVLIGTMFQLLWNSTEFYSSDYNITGTVFGGYLLSLAIVGIGADLQIVITMISTYIIFYVIKKSL